jgi:small GTP-binding protein
MISREHVFIAAITEKSQDKLRAFLSNPDFNVNVKNSQGIPALLIAAKIGWFEGCELLLRHPQIDIHDPKLKNILHRVSVMVPRTLTQITNLERIIDLLLRKGVSINFQNEKKETPLHKAVKVKSFHAVNILLKNRANYFIEDRNGDTVLHLIVYNNDETIAKLFVKEYNLGDKQVAKKYNYVVCLLDILFKQMPKQKAEEMFLHAVAQNYLQQIKYFVEKKIDVNVVSPKDSRSALQIAASEGYYSLFLFLLKQPNIIVTRYNEWVNQTVYYLLKKSPQTKSDCAIYSNLLRYLVRPSIVNIPNHLGETVLHEAAFRGNLIALNILFECGASITVKTKQNETVFHYALRAPLSVRAIVFETLLRHCKEPNLQLFLLTKGPEGSCIEMIKKYHFTDVDALLSFPTTEFTARRWERDYPYELWLEIFTYLPPKELAVVMSVCRTFYQIANDPSLNILKETKETMNVLTMRTSDRYRELAEQIFVGPIPQQLVPKTLQSRSTLATFKNIAIRKLRSIRKLFKAPATIKTESEQSPSPERPASPEPPIGTQLHLFHILVVGDGNTGKSSLIYRFTDDIFPSPADFGRQWSFRERKIRIQLDSILLRIWMRRDINNQTRYPELPAYHLAHLALILFDLTNPNPKSSKEPFGSVLAWREEVEKYCQENIPVILVGTKSDLSNHVLHYEQIKEFVDANNFAYYFECSAKLGRNVGVLFYYSAKLLCEKKTKTRV